MVIRGMEGMEMKCLLSALVISLIANPAFASRVSFESQCSSGQIVYNYDGPGSNYAAGGLYTLSKQGDSKENRFLVTDGEDPELVLGSVVSGETVGVAIKVLSLQETSAKALDRKVGDRCEANEYDSLKLSWTTTQKIEVTGLTQAASARLNLKAGDQLTLNCQVSKSVPAICPESGLHSEDSLRVD